MSLAYCVFPIYRGGADSMDESLYEAESLYGSFNLMYDFSSIKYLINKGYAGQGKYSPNVLQLPYWDHTLVLVEAGIKAGEPNKRPEDAEDIINEWLSAGYSLAVLHGFILEEMRNLGFFITERTIGQLVILGKRTPEWRQFVEMVLSLEMEIAEAQVEMIEESQ